MALLAFQKMGYAVSALEITKGGHMRLYADSTKCSGCNACRVACSLNLFGAGNPKMAALIIEPHFPAPGVYEVKVCTQCGDCAAVCRT